MLLALLVGLVSAVPDISRLHALRVLAAELYETPERQPIELFASPLVREGEEIDEFFGGDEPGAHLRAVRLTLLQDRRLPDWIKSLTLPARAGPAHPARGPPTA